MPPQSGSESKSESQSQSESESKSGSGSAADKPPQPDKAPLQPQPPSSASAAVTSPGHGDNRPGNGESAAESAAAAAAADQPESPGQHLDLLLQHYQNVLGKSPGAAEQQKASESDDPAHKNNDANHPEYYSSLLHALSGPMAEQLEGGAGRAPEEPPAKRPRSQPAAGQAKVAPPQHSVSQTSLKRLAMHPTHSSQPPVQYPRSSFYVGPTSIFDISIVDRIKLDSIDQIQISKTLALRKVAPRVQFLLRDDYNQKLYAEQEQQVDIVERLVHPHGRLLVEIFFKRVHPYFPILHERVFLEKYLRSYRELTTPLLACIYALALQWWDFHPKLIGFPRPDVGALLNEIAFRTFFERIERPKLSMIQTGLLLLQCRSECPNNWVLCSNIVALAEELGLGVSCQDWKLPKWEKDLRKRLAWAVWATDKWTALIEGRHSHLILGRNWMVNVLRRGDFPPVSPIIQGFGNMDSGNTAAHTPATLNAANIGLYDMALTEDDCLNGNIMFQQMVALSIIVGEIMDTFYTQGAIHVNTNIEQVLKLAKPLQLKLREWYHSLPPQLSMNAFTPKKFNCNATLTLIYFAAEITLHRKIISSLRPNTPRELVQVCRTAAKTRLIAAIEFVGDLKNEHINAFWYSCSTGDLMLIGTFAALLYVTAPTPEEATTFRDLMRNYIWVLRVRSKSFDKLRNALDNIHMLLAQIPGLLTDNDDEPANTNQVFRTPSVSATPKTGGPARPPLNTSHPISQDIFNGLGNLVDSTTQLNNFGNDIDMENIALREGNFHHGSPSSYASTPTIENELMMNMVNEHRARMNNRSNPTLFEDNQSPKSDLQGTQGSPSFLNQKKPQFSPKHPGNSPSPRVAKPAQRSPSRADSVDSQTHSQGKRHSVDIGGASHESQAARSASTSQLNSDQAK